MINRKLIQSLNRNDFHIELHTLSSLNPLPVSVLQLFRINEANQLMQYDQCLTKAADNTVIITHCNLKEYTEWRYFKVSPKSV